MGILTDALSRFLQALYDLTVNMGVPNYGLAIIIFTVVVKLVMLPLTAQQLRSMGKMQELAPKVADLKKKHKDNPQKINQATMELYQKEKVNPFAGCLPLVIQMPILFALFNALRKFFDPALNPALDTANQDFFWIPNLGVADPYILPVLAALTTFLQQWFSMPKQGDQTQRTMLYIMPLMMGWFSRSFPAGLALYWVTYSVVSAIEHMVLKRQPKRVKEEVKA